MESLKAYPIQFLHLLLAWCETKIWCVWVSVWFSFPSSLLLPAIFSLSLSSSSSFFNCLCMQVCVCVCVIFCPPSLSISLTSLSIFLFPVRWWRLQHHTAFLHISHVFLIKRLMLLFTIRLCSTPARSHTHDEASHLGRCKADRFKGGEIEISD